MFQSSWLFLQLQRYSKNRSRYMTFTTAAMAVVLIIMPRQPRHSPASTDFALGHPVTSSNELPRHATRSNRWAQNFPSIHDPDSHDRAHMD